MAKKIEGYFVCTDGVIWTAFSNHGKFSTNMDAKIDIADSRDGTYKEVRILAKDGDETVIHDEYVLWPSIIDLAIAIEKEPIDPENEVMTLDEAIIEAHEQVSRFKKKYLQGVEENPEYYPIQVERGNAGTWFEQIYESE